MQHPPNPLQRENSRQNSPFEGGRGDVRLSVENHEVFHES